jgi:DNA primase
LISSKSIQEVLDVAQVTDVIEDYVTLKRRGANMMGLCPFHDEKTPSFTVSPSKNIYKCFGCGKGGGAVQFIMEHDNLSFPETIRHLAKRYNITLEEDGDFDQKAYNDQKKVEESYFIINDFAADFFKNNLHNTDEGKLIALSYFKERGFNGQTVEKFDLGYALDNGTAFTEKAKAAQYNLEFMQTLGLTSKNGYDFFRSRVMFPIHNLTGKIIAFAGRTLSNSKKQPKYINSPETPIYNKRKILYGMHLAKAAIKKADNCFIVEGYTDVISMHQNGVENVAASSGTSLTTDQVRLVKRYTNNITFLYDGDAAGIKASIRGLDIVLESDMNARLVSLPEGDDPDSFVKKMGNDGFLNFVEENSKDFIHFKMDMLKEEALANPIKKSEVINDILNSIAKIRDAIKRSLYVKECAQLFDIEETLLVRETNKVIRNNIKQKRVEKEREERRQLGDVPDETEYIPEEQIYHQQTTKFATKRHHEYQEKDLARIIVMAGNLDIKDEDGSIIKVADLIYSNINDVFDYFTNDLYKRIIQEGFNISEAAEEVNIVDHFVRHSDPEISAFAIDSNSTKYEYANWESKEVSLQTQKAPENNFYLDSIQSIYRFKLKKVNLVLKELGKRIAVLTAEAPDKINDALEGYKELTEIKKEIANKLGTVIPGE